MDNIINLDEQLTTLESLLELLESKEQLILRHNDQIIGYILAPDVAFRSTRERSDHRHQRPPNYSL